MYFFGSDSNLPTQSWQQNPISCFSYSDVFPETMSLPVMGHFLLIGSSKEISSADFEDFFLNSFTLPMYFFGSDSNLPTQSWQQKPISCFSYSDVLPETMSLPVIGHFLLIGSSKEISSADFFFLNSFTLPMYFFGSASNLPLQSSQQKPISCFSYSTVFVGLMSLPVSGQVLLIGSSNEISSADFFFLNSFTFPMYFFGSDSNLPLQSSQQKPISCFSYSAVFVGFTSLPVSGQVLLIGSPSKEISSSADFEDFFLNSF